jgi:hypothetical protein
MSRAADVGNHPGTHGDNTGDGNSLTSKEITILALPVPSASW